MSTIESSIKTEPDDPFERNYQELQAGASPLPPQMPTASVLVIVLQGADATAAHHLKWLFADPYFTVHVCSIDPPRRIPNYRTLNAEQFLENYHMRKALAYAGEGPYLMGKSNEIIPLKLWHAMPCIIVKEDSMSAVMGMPQAQTVMRERIQTALERAEQADLFFLSEWDPDATSRTTSSPIQAIMFKPSARDRIRNGLVTAKIPLDAYLSSHIAQGQLLATFFVPAIIEARPSEVHEQPSLKSNQQVAPPPATAKPNLTTISMWSVIILMIIVVVAWMIMQFTRRSNAG